MLRRRVVIISVAAARCDNLGGGGGRGVCVGEKMMEKRVGIYKGK